MPTLKLFTSQMSFLSLNKEIHYTEGANTIEPHMRALRVLLHFHPEAA